MPLASQTTGIATHTSHHMHDQQYSRLLFNKIFSQQMMLLYYANIFPAERADIILYSATTRDHVGDSTLHTQIGSKLHSTSQSAHSTDHSSNSTRNSDSSENASNTTTESNDVFILAAVGAGSGGLVMLGTILTLIVLCLWKCWQAKHRGMHVCT